jgi:hypothetical protein
MYLSHKILENAVLCIRGKEICHIKFVTIAVKMKGFRNSENEKAM